MINYKKIIMSRTLRLKILSALSFVPDKLMISVQYRIKTGHRLNLTNPVRFTEKLQWYKLNYRNPLMIQCVDKYDVRDYIKSKGLERILVPCYGVYDSVDSIDWDYLPNQFVMKDTLGDGGNAVVVVTDKQSEDISCLKKKAASWLAIDSRRRSSGREWPYYNGKKHRIIIEQYLESDPSEGGLIDYKIFCFNGKAVFLYVMSDREFGKGASLGIFDSDFNKINAYRADERPMKRIIQRPKMFDDMKCCAEELSKDFPEARVDFYEVAGELKFGEITFFDGSGYMTFVPDDFDITMGQKFIISE